MFVLRLTKLNHRTVFTAPTTGYGPRYMRIGLAIVCEIVNVKVIVLVNAL